ncbi:MAG: carboxypeptidase regulatory-like domain-containing protein [Candidatus Aminicenantes bacterium]|nr:carboxypeptidase regulatory-like domain-containing protein [Candidatus Aminicenantes bacterium]
MRHRHPYLPFLILFLFFPLFLTAKETGEIRGKVLEKDGTGLPGVEISAEGPNLQGSRTTISTQNGDFHLPLLPVGSYTLSFKLSGFRPVLEKNVIIRLGTSTHIEVTMIMSEITREIVVTAESPLLDKTATDTSFHLTTTDLENVPSQNRTVVDVVKFAPGVTGVRADSRHGTASEGQPSFRGEGEEGNNWIVDGLSISGVRLKNSGFRLNLDSIDEIQIISDPFSPEFGSAYGGIINMVTKSGSNDYEGTFSLIFMDKRLQAPRQEQLSVVSEPEYFSDYNWYFNLGGPVIKDKLWFFLSDNLYSDTVQTQDNTIDYLFIPGGEKSLRDNQLFSKLTYAPAVGHNLSLTSIFNTSLSQKGGIGIPELFEKKTYTDLAFQANYKGILSPSAFIEAGLGWVKRGKFTQPDDKNLGPAMYYIEDLARNVHNSYGNVTDDQQRLDLSLKYTQHFDTKTFGHHEIGLGFEFYSLSSEFAVDFTGTEEDLFPGNSFDNGTKYYFESWAEGKRTPTFFYEYGNFDFINSTRGIGLYIKDKMTWERFTIMAGLRTQTQLCLDNNGEKLWSWGLADFISPRLTLTVDILGDGANIIRLGWGRFSDLITTMPLGLLNSGAGLVFRTYRWQGSENPSAEEIGDPSFWAFETEQKDQPFEIAENITPNFLTRFLVELNRKLGRDWVIKARYVGTQADDLLEVLAVFDPVTGYKFLYDNFEYKRRKYHGLEFELMGRIGPNFYLNASYCTSSAEGTNPGQTETGSWSQEEGSTNYLGLFGNHLYIPDLPELSDIKAYYDWALGGLGGRGIGDEGWYGKLPYSVDHDVKVNVLFSAPCCFTLSAAFEWISGYHWEKLGYVPFFGGYYSFPEGRGTRETPGHTYLDVAIERDINLPGLFRGRKTVLTLRLDFFNLFDSQQPISYVKEDIPIFGQVWGRQQPRQARLSFKLKW